MRKESTLPLPHRNSFFESMRQFCFSSFFSDIYIDYGLSPRVKLPVLLPFYWVWRLIYKGITKRKKVTQEIKAIKAGK